MIGKSFKLYILFLFTTIALHTVNGQETKQLQTKTASKVYVISNRQVNFKDNRYTALNSVKENTSLDFITASAYSKDSLQISKTDSIEFLSEISSIEGNWLVFVHGDAKTFEQSILRGLAIKEQYNINVIVFSWPSKSSNLHGVRNLKNSQFNVGVSLNHFVNMLYFIQKFKEVNPAFGDDKKISLLFHSLGNLYMKKFIENELQAGFSNELFDNLILNAAAVNQEDHKIWVEKLNIQKRIYNNSNKHDFNLKGLRIFTKEGKQLGEKITPVLAKNTNYTFFDKSVGFRIMTGRTHSYFIGKLPSKSRNIKEFYSLLFHGEEPEFSNQSKFYLRKDNLGNEIIF
jgi:esterase/lipase superfamily enzyme